MGEAALTLKGKSGKSYSCRLGWADNGGGLGCHAKTISGVTVSFSGKPTWDIGDDIRANRDNWPIIYKVLGAGMGAYTHIVMSDNFATHGPRDEYRKRFEATGSQEQYYANPIWRTSEIMDIIASLAEENGESMTLTPTSGNAVHVAAEGYSACITGVWLRKASPAVVIAKTMREFWDKAKQAIGATERHRIDPASLSRDPEKIAKQVEETKKRVSNIWGE